MNDPHSHHRRSNRLKGYDYTQPGAYFVTICTSDRGWLFGVVAKGKMLLNQFGNIVDLSWQKLTNHFTHIELGTSVIMPNHFHGIIIIPGTGEASGSLVNKVDDKILPDASPLHPIGTISGSLGAIIQNFKSITARRINQIRVSPGKPVWQRNYYEHIIRDQREWERIHNYILMNPQNWEKDQLHHSL